MDEPEGVTLTDLLRRHIDSLMIIARKKRRGDETNTKIARTLRDPHGPAGWAAPMAPALQAGCR